MDKITRKTLIYKTGVEYGDYTLNHVLGCSHGCKYPCYAMLLKKRFGEIASYQDWIIPRLVGNYKEILVKELPKYKDQIKTLHLCFTTDPFMVGHPEIINASVLTKGVYPDEMTRLPKDFTLGITLISLDENFRLKMEPGSAPYIDRISSLKKMSELGFSTWVSIEPYPTPNLVDQDLNAILEAVSFVDKIIFGRTNYSKEVSSFKNHKDFYNNAANEVIKFCNEKKIDYHIKVGTLT